MTNTKRFSGSNFEPQVKQTKGQDKEKSKLKKQTVDNSIKINAIRSKKRGKCQGLFTKLFLSKCSSRNLRLLNSLEFLLREDEDFL